MPDCDMARLWQRLINGNMLIEDIVLLKHEIREMEYVQKGISQDKAHAMESEEFNYSEMIRSKKTKR